MVSSLSLSLAGSGLPLPPDKREESRMNAASDHVLRELWIDAQRPEFLWQAGVLMLCLALAWLLSRSLRLSDREGGVAWKRVGAGGLNRVLFPLLALGLVLGARPLLAAWHHVNLLHVAVPLLASMALIRVLFYALRHVMAPGS